MQELYREFINSHPEYYISVNEDFPIRTITDPDIIDEMEKRLGRSIGIVYEDAYLTLVRDAVIFPDGTEGTYIRQFPANTGAVVILPVIDGKFLFLEHYRHNIQKSVLEIPRGFGEAGLSPIENAAKELKEECGIAEAKITFLGHSYPDSGISTNCASIYMAEYTGALPFVPVVEDTNEGISRFFLLTMDDIKEKIKNGELTDGFTLTAFGLMLLSGKI